MDKKSLLTEALLQHLNARVEDLLIHSPHTRPLDCGCTTVTINDTEWDDLVTLSEDCRNFLHHDVIPKHRLAEYHLVEEFKDID